MGTFPENAKFAFTIFDDTDDSTLENVDPVYRLLEELGVRTTKSVWSLPNVPGARYGGGTLHDCGYLRWVLQLKERGFEIAMHNVRNSDSPRSVVENGFLEFERRVGSGPRIHANHSQNRENIYWGEARLSLPAVRLGYRLAQVWQQREGFFGHVPGSEFFWGDICRERIDYVRNFVFPEINLERVNPSMPYHDPARPYVKAWFSGSEGHDCGAFCDMLRESNQDRLEEESGFCIMYTHFACGFCSGGRVDTRFERLMRRLAAKKGWFVPVSTLLDFLAARRGGFMVSAGELAGIERRWFLGKLFRGTS